MNRVDILLSGVVVVCFGLFLVGLAALILIRPSHAARFLNGFASSALTHYAEQGMRLVVGVALLTFAGSMRYPQLFTLFGWLIIGSTAVLLLIPWQWHHRFAGLVMPPVLRAPRLLALGAVALGGFILYCAAVSV